MSQQQNIYGGKDPRDIAVYTVAEASRYLGIPPPTLRSWVAGQSYTEALGRPYFDRLFTAPEYDPPRLSFNNLIEAHVLRALRIKHKVSVRAAREAIRFAEKKLNLTRLFLSLELRTGAKELLLEKYGELINLNKSGQMAMKTMLDEHVGRIEVDQLNVPARLFPSERAAKIIVIDPRISFGRPVVASRNISTAAIVDRINVGETVEDIAADYKITREEIYETITYEAA